MCPECGHDPHIGRCFRLTGPPRLTQCRCATRAKENPDGDANRPGGDSQRGHGAAGGADSVAHGGLTRDERALVTHLENVDALRATLREAFGGQA